MKVDNKDIREQYIRETGRDHYSGEGTTDTGDTIYGTIFATLAAVAILGVVLVLVYTCYHVDWYAIIHP